MIGDAGAKLLGKAVERLERARAERILAVPLYLRDDDMRLQRIRYALGLRESPADADLRDVEAARKKKQRARGDFDRVSTKLPVAMTGAMDEDPLLIEILAERLKQAARDPERDAVILVGPSGGSEDEDRRRRARLQRLAELAQQRTTLRSVHTAALRLDAGNADLEKDLAGLKKTARRLSRGRRVVVLPFEFTDEGLGKAVERGLDGVFYRLIHKPLAPHPNIVKWVRRSLESGRSLTNQRWFTKPFEAEPSGFSPRP